MKGYIILVDDARDENLPLRALKKSNVANEVVTGDGVEADKPNDSIIWKFLWAFDEDERVKTQSLLDDLNKINAPVQLRIVANTH